MEAGSVSTISPDDVVLAGAVFEKNEGRDSMYRVASFLLRTFWGQIPDMVDALTVLLLTWNSAFYRYGAFDQNALENWLRTNWKAISAFHERNILSFSAADETAVATLFRSLLDALQIPYGKHKGYRSPVAVVKALHLLAPEFFPLWDKEIAKNYRCAYDSDPGGAYVRFMRINRNLTERLAPLLPKSDRSLLKRIDEYNYVNFTQKGRWKS